ncbi:type VI secretion system tip protein VgrG [Halomonas sp. ISL-60]|nr:type VI secretion system tip protein VgrG [Halomonas sp. ISL-60]MBT2803322.1 type VI secretion system tip protein VgrG [Halomonas sp. ISL-56]
MFSLSSDRYSASNETDNCWVRVAQGWAGGGYGSMAIPRIGHEVVISHLEADPDQPLITGRTYHAVNRPPYPLPAYKTRTVIRTQSHKSKGFNELSFEDATGEEQIWLHAQKDLDLLTLNDSTEDIKRDSTLHVFRDRTTDIDRDETRTVHRHEVHTVHGNETHTVDGNETFTVHKNRRKTVDGNETDRIGKNWSNKVGKNKTETIGKAYLQNVGMACMENVGLGYSLNVGALMNTLVGLSQSTQVGLNHSLNVGRNITLKAGKQITLQVGNSRLVLSEDTIYRRAFDVRLSRRILMYSEILKNPTSPPD